MKAKLLLSALLLVNVLCAQKNEKNEKKVVFFGFDFSKAKMIGQGEFSDPQKIRDTYFPAWNAHFEKHRDDNECSVKKNFKKETVIYDLGIVTERNKEVDVPNLVITDQNYYLSNADISNVVSNYNSDLKGLGLVIVVESFNKPKHLATIHATFFDIQSKKVLFTKPLKGKASGMFGFQYYWLSGLVRGFRSFKYK